jgi:hypothetical protein
MKLSKAASTLFAIITIIYTNLYAQSPPSIQVNGGIIAPRSSSSGLTAVMQYNNPVNIDIQLFFSIGFASWDKYKIKLIEEYSNTPSEKIFNSYNADDHEIIPVYVGSKITLRKLKELVSFFTAEIGYSHLSYNKYDNYKITNYETGEVVGYAVDNISRKKISENLIGIGLGIELLHPMSKNLNLQFIFKVNTYLNSDYYKFYSQRATYFNYLFGVSYNL